MIFLIIIISFCIFFRVWVLKPPLNCKMLSTKKNMTCDMRSFFTHDLEVQVIPFLSRLGFGPKNIIPLVEVSMELKFFRCVSLPFWHIVSPDIGYCFYFFVSSVEGRGFFWCKEGLRREKRKGGWKTDLEYI